MKSVLVIGLGRFGSNMVKTLVDLKNEVMAVDISEERVENLLPILTGGQIGDSTNEHFIKSLGVGNFDLCVVAIGDDFQSSVITTSLLKDYGAKFVLARASDEVHAKFLKRNGADRVVFAEKEMAKRLAIKYSSNSIFEYFELSPEISMWEIQPPKTWVGKSVIDLDVRRKHNLSVIAIKQNGQIVAMPGAEHVFDKNETLILLGNINDIKKVTD